ncbi:hypothetical protein Patl1_21292 [Pistacia atlantica]|uniref:Uncharacterized protein n=1 Tax=Pistacia atlantica TaxID=434234 RepID=A0ACC1BJU1_9ROSI|nr:hypothetical protein Patl1_21292 [Pistacia atlantica]
MVGSFGVRKGAWTEEEDNLLRKCIEVHGEGKWHQVPLRGGLNRCRKSCRLRWSLIAARLPGRTSNDVKNYWNTHIQRKRVSNKKVVSHETTEVVKPIVIRPRPRSFSKSSPWLRKNNISALIDNVNNPSPAWQPQALEHDHKWWESLLNDKEDNGSGSTCPAPELEGEPITNLWLQAIAAEKEMVDTTVENGKNEWRDISLEADDIWNLLSAI